MKNGKEIIFIFGIFLSLSLAPMFSHASLNQKRQEYNRLSLEQAQMRKTLSKNMGEKAAASLISQRVKTANELYKKCMSSAETFADEVQAVPSLAKPLSGRVTANMLREELRTLNVGMMQEYDFRYSVKESQESIERNNQLLSNVESQFAITEPQLRYLLPAPSSLISNEDYYAGAWNYYLQNRAKYKNVISEASKSCGGAKVDLSSPLNQRRDYLNKLFAATAGVFTEAFRSEIEEKYIEANGISPELDAVLSARGALNEMNRQYRAAVFDNSDYFKARQILKSYEDVGSTLLGVIAPMDGDPSVRFSVQGAVSDSLNTSRKSLQILEKGNPSEWVAKRYERVKTRISRGEIACQTKCQNMLNEAAGLILAGAMVEEKFGIEAYSMVANYLIEKAVKR